MFEVLQSVADEDAVFFVEWYDIGDGTECSEADGLFEEFSHAW